MQQENYDAGSFHDPRVEIKKLRALFELIDFCVKGFARKKSLKPLLGIFRQAGKVREIHVEDELIRKHFAENLPLACLEESDDRLHNERQFFFLR